MGYWHSLWESITPQGHQRRYNDAYAKITGATPMKPVGAPTYYLRHYVIRKHRDAATVHLHGVRSWPLTGKRIEYITVRFLEGESDLDLLRCAAWMSPCIWRVPWFQNITQYQGKWNAPLEARLQTTLTDPSQISVSD